MKKYRVDVARLRSELQGYSRVLGTEEKTDVEPFLRGKVKKAKGYLFSQEASFTREPMGRVFTSCRAIMTLLTRLFDTRTGALEKMDISMLCDVPLENRTELLAD